MTTVTSYRIAFVLAVLLLLLKPVEGNAQSLAFASDRTGRFQIWRVLVEDPTNLQQVTFTGTGGQESRSPDWSFAQNRIAYQFGASGVREIHAITPDGKGADDTRLTNLPGDGRDPSWSPDGNYIVYSRLIGSDYDLWIHSVGTSSSTNADYVLLERPTSLDLRPSWSPDGKRIVFVTSGGAVGPDAEIAVVDVEEFVDLSSSTPTKRIRTVGGVKLLTNNSFVDFDPTWSPDSSSIAFSSTRSGNRDIFRMSATYGECVDKATTPEACARFAQLTSSFAEDRNPAWSPDGALIAFVSERDGNPEIYVMSSETGETDLKRITTSPARDDDPSWEPKPSVRIAVDANRDGSISLLTHEDDTSPTKPFRFWLNNDRDAFVGDDFEDLDPGLGLPDSDVKGIQTVRDLEDFLRLHIRLPVSFDPFSPDWKVEVFFQPTSGNPKITLYKAVNPETGYLTSPLVAAYQFSEPEVLSVDAVPVLLDNALFTRPNKTSYFIFEGVSAGEGALTVRVYRAGLLVAEDKTYLDLRDIKTMYDHWTVGDDTTTGFALIPSVPIVVNSAAFAPEVGQYIVFVHGWRMRPWERRAFAETAYKRLWHRGYRGGFGFFSWPTEYQVSPDLTTLSEWLNYDRSERNAWHSASGLHYMLVKKNSEYPGQVRIFAHSMGNIVASEALRQGVELGEKAMIHTYVPTQAAVPADAYDKSVLPVAPPLCFYPTLYPTPSPYAEYNLTGKPYFADIGVFAKRLVNFFNPVDYALVNWAYNNERKPIGSVKCVTPSSLLPILGFTYVWSGVAYGPSSPGFYRLSAGGGGKTLLNFAVPKDRYEAFAFAVRSRSVPLGRENNIKGPFSCAPMLSCELDLDKTLGFGDKPNGHSAQFLSSIQQRYEYWDAMLNAMLIYP